MTDMQDRIKELAIEVGLIDCVNDHGQLIIDRGPYNDELTRFAQAIARECAEICDVMPYRAAGAGKAAQAIRARYGIAEE